MASSEPLTSPSAVEGPISPYTSELSPPPPPPSEGLERSPWGQLPPGWSTAVSPIDGRLYYWEPATGRTSWTHPLAMQGRSHPSSTLAANNYNISDDDLGPLPSRKRPWMRNWWASSRSEYHDTPWNATRRPENHQCYAVTALLLCPPIGLLALYQSISVDRAWSDSRYGDAVNHSRQATQYACLGTFLGIVFWLWYFLDLDRGQVFDWFRFD